MKQRSMCSIQPIDIGYGIIQTYTLTSICTWIQSKQNHLPDRFHSAVTCDGRASQSN